MLKLLFPLSLVLFASPLFGQASITTSALPNPIVGKAVSGTVWTLSASGGTTPYSWVVSLGSLPAGLSLSPAGTITGTATSAGAATFTLRLTDSAFATATKQFTITAQNAIGRGCTTATMIDHDCDGYGVGSPLGMDADDEDATVNTPASMLAKYGTLANFLSTVKGYTPAHIWYLATTGNNSTCVIDDITHPCATWEATYGHLLANEAMVIRGGTYDEANNYRMGGVTTTSGTPIIIMAYPGEKPILNHSLTSGLYGITSDFGVTNNYRIDGITITNTGGYAYAMGINSSGTNYIIRNCEVSGYDRNIWLTPQDGFIIENSSVHDDNGEHAIYLAQNSDSGGPSTNVTIRGNLLYNSSRDNFHFNGVCVGCALTGNIMYGANLAGGGAGAISLQQGWNHSDISNNVVLYTSASALVIDDYYDSNPSIPSYDQNYNTFINNTFIHTGVDKNNNLSTNGFCTVLVITNTTVTPLDLGHNTYSNNIFVETATGGYQPGSTPPIVGCVVRYNRNNVGDPDWLSTDTWTNNVIYASNGAPPLTEVAGAFTSSNAWTKTWAEFGSRAAVFTGNINADPLLTALDNSWYATPGLYNLRVSSGSPAVGAGLHTGAPATDIRGNPRANPPDIGAYQYTAVTSSQGFCDLNHDGLVNFADVASAISQALGTTPCTNGDLDGNGICNVVDVQRVINAALGGICAYH
jgi:hypothetical protein